MLTLIQKWTPVNLLELLGYSPFFSVQAELLGESNLVPARVAADGRDVIAVIGIDAGWARPSGRLRHAIDSGTTERPIVGDWLLVSEEGDEAVIHHVLDRRSCLRRRAAGSDNRAQVIAANVDVFFVVIAVGRDFNLRRAERFLAAVWESGASPVLVLNKIDQVASIDELTRDLTAVAMGAPLVSVSAQTGAGMDALRAHLGTGITAAFIGSSGVGKSTLVNRLLERSQQSTSPLGVAGKGVHTTSRRELIPLASGGVLIDTPGIREFGLVQLEGLDVAFADICSLARQCHFADCRHTHEPGCAVTAAVTTGALSGERLSSYLRLRSEAEATHSRRTAAEASDAKKRKKAINKRVKSFFKNSTKYR